MAPRTSATQMEESIQERHEYKTDAQGYGYWDSAVTIVRNSVAAVDTRVWYAIGGWIVLSMGNYGVAQYHVGKSALFQARGNNPNVDPMEEYRVVSDAVKNASWKLALESLVLPVTIVRGFVPQIVLYLNPKQPPMQPTRAM